MRMTLAAMAGASLICIGSGAVAQTECFPNNPAMPAAGTTCHDIGPPPMPNNNGGGGGTDVRFNCNGFLSANLPYCKRKRAAEAAHQLELKEVAALVSAGDCKGAIRRALADQDFDTAGKAKQLCEEK